MSFSRTKRESIKKYILEKITEGASDLVPKTTKVFSVTPNTVYRYLRELVNDNVIRKDGKKYSLEREGYIYTLQLSEIAPDSEDKVYEQFLEPVIKSLPDNVIQMWNYCFTEMFNNVIDHSEATKVSIYIVKDYMNTSVLIDDDGVGIFNKIRDHYNFDSIEDAIMELFKGKLTTDTDHHSGEGVFFSSRIMDVFAAISSGKIFSHTEFSELLEDLNTFPSLRDIKAFQVGTAIMMKLSNFSKKTSKEVFDQYANDDGGFTKTRIPIKNIYPIYPVSRSQAKRLAHRLESFQEVELDFDGVSEIGQGFAHELFVVFQKQHPEVKLIPFNASLDIQRMINHVLN